MHSYSSNQWQIGDYYQFQVSTVGQSQIGLVFDQTSSATGPRDFKVQYSTNGTTFTDSGFSYSVLANAAPNPLWSTRFLRPVTPSLPISAQFLRSRISRPYIFVSS